MIDTTAATIAGGGGTFKGSYYSPTPAPVPPPVNNPTTRIAGVAPGADLPPGATTHGNFDNASEPSVISTDSGRKVLQDAIAKHNTDMTNLRSGSGDTSTATDTTGKKDTGNSDATTWAMKQVGGVTADEAQAAGLDLSQYSYDQGSGYFLPNGGSKASQDQYANDKKTINDAFSAQMTQMDTSTQALMDSIKGIYDQRIADQQDANKRELQGFDTMNVRNGTSRYAGGVAQSILTADENAGLGRIQKIALEEANQLSQANDNLQNKKYTAFMDNRAALDKLATERKTTLKDLQDKAVTAQDKANQQKIQSSRDNAVAGLMEQGITDPKQLLDYLNNDNNGNQVGDFTAKDVSDAMSSLSSTDNYKDLSGSTRDFFVMKSKGLLPDSIANLPPGQQLFAYLRQEKQAATITKGGGTGIEPSKDAINQGLAVFRAPGVRGEDQYVDPYVYKNLFNSWTVTNGFSPESFVKAFPPGDYINPDDNAILPEFLRTATKKASSSSSSSRSL